MCLRQCQPQFLGICPRLVSLIDVSTPEAILMDALWSVRTCFFRSDSRWQVLSSFCCDIALQLTNISAGSTQNTGALMQCGGGATTALVFICELQISNTFLALNLFFSSGSKAGCYDVAACSITVQGASCLGYVRIDASHESAQSSVASARNQIAACDVLELEVKSSLFSLPVTHRAWLFTSSSSDCAFQLVFCSPCKYRG